MLLLTVFSLLGILIFGAFAIYLSIKEEKTQKLLIEKEESQKQRMYELSILREIQERIGYELDIEKVADVITGSLTNLFSFSTVSSLLLKEDKLIFKTIVAEKVSHAFVNQIKNTLLASLGALTERAVPQNIEEVTTGIVLDDTNSLPVGSFFNIPLIIDNEVLGIINTSSTKPGLYKEDQMTILYQITGLASSAITKLHQVLASEQGKLTAMISSLADGVFMVNTKKQMQTINLTAKTILDITKAEPSMIDVAQAIGNNVDLSSMMDEVLSTQNPLPAKEIRIQEKDIQLFFTPVKDTSEKTLLGVSVLLHDVTLEKNLEQMKDDFTNMMVHELRAPLTAIRGASSLMQKETQLSAQEKAKMLSIITNQSTQLLSLVGSILDAAKLESGKFVLQKVPTDIKKVVDQSIALFSTQAQTKQITISTHTDSDFPVQIALDPIRFGEVMNNLISNALKYTPEGGQITVGIKKDTSSVILGTNEVRTPESINASEDESDSGPIKIDRNFQGKQARMTNHLQVSVSDTGVGIQKEKQADLFSKFYQVSHEKSDLRYMTKGTGLGLYIVKGIIEAHGGHVWLTSEVGKGTTVGFTLPYTVTKTVESTPPSKLFNTTVN